MEKNPTGIKNGFRRAGIYPTNPDAINYKACDPSKKFRSESGGGDNTGELGEQLAGGITGQGSVCLDAGYSGGGDHAGELVEQLGGGITGQGSVSVDAPTNKIDININLSLAARKRKFDSFRLSVLDADQESHFNQLYEEGHRDSTETLFVAYSILRSKAEVDSFTAAQDAVSRMLPTSFTASRGKKAPRLPPGEDRYDPSGEAWRKKREEEAKKKEEKAAQQEEKRRRAAERAAQAAIRKENQQKEKTRKIKERTEQEEEKKRRATERASEAALKKERQQMKMKDKTTQQQEAKRRQVGDDEETSCRPFKPSLVDTLVMGEMTTSSTKVEFY